MIKGRVLFISNLPFADVGNNGKTFQSLFFGFQNEEIAQLFFNDTTPSGVKFTNYYRITDLDILKYLLSFGLFKIQGDVKNSIDERNIRISTQLPNFPLFKKILRNFIFSIINLFNVKSFTHWIRDFKPTSIFLIGSNYTYSYRILILISKYFKIPYYVYFTDDYFLYNIGDGFFSKIQHYFFLKRTKKIVEGAKELFVISKKMQEEYESFFRLKCTVLINAVDKMQIDSIDITEYDSIIFRYFGALHSNRSASLRYLAECLDYINKNFNKKCVLEIYSMTASNSKIDSDLDIETIRLCEPITGEILKEKMESSAFLVHAESFSPTDMKVTMLSISTKIPEYLSSNRCIVAVGPSDIASIQIFKYNNIGIVLDNPKSIKMDAMKLLNVLNDPKIYQNYCQNAEYFFYKEFDASNMREYLKNKLLKN